MQRSKDQLYNMIKLHQINKTQQIRKYKTTQHFTKRMLRLWYIFVPSFSTRNRGSSWSWTYGSWIYDYLCNQYLTPLMLWFESYSNDTTLCDKVRQWLVIGQCFSLGTPVSSTNKTDCRISKILLKVALNTITLGVWSKIFFFFSSFFFRFNKYILYYRTWIIPIPMVSSEDYSLPPL